MKKLLVLIAGLALLAAACGGGDGGSDELSISEWCAINEDVEAANSIDDTATVAAIIDEYGDRVPDEVEDDIAVLGDFLSDPENAVLSEVEEAGANISAFADENCGTSSDSGDTSDSDSGDTSDSDSGDDVDSSDDDADDSDGADIEFDEDDTVRDLVVDSLKASGLSDEEADCVADQLDFDEFLSGEFNPFDFINTFETCGVDLENLG